MPVFGQPFIAGLLVTIGAVAANAQAPRLLPPRLNPLAERRMDIREWESSSSSPFGGSRLGGTDRRQFAFSPDGKLVATEDAGGWQLELWDVASGDSLGRFGRINDPVALAFSPDSSRLLTASLDYHSPCPVDVWDVRTKKRVNLDEDVNTTPFPAVAWSPDGKTLALGSGPSRRNRQPAIAFWDAVEGEELTRFDAAPRDPNLPWFTPAYQCLTFAPDGRTLAGVREQRIHLWEVLTGKLRTVLAVLPPVYGKSEETGQRATGLSFSRDGRILAVGCNDGLIRLWDVPNAAELPPLAGHQDALRAVLFVADGKSLLSLGADNRVPHARWRPGDVRERLCEPLPDKPAGVADQVARFPVFAVELLHLPDKPAGVAKRDDLVRERCYRSLTVAARGSAVAARRPPDRRAPAPFVPASD